MSNEVEREAYHKWKSGAEPYGFNGFTAFQAGAEWQRTQAQPADALVEALERIYSFVPKTAADGVSGGEEWNRCGRYAAKLARAALATYRAAQEKPHD